MAFTQEIEKALSRIAEAPLRYPAGEHGTRELVLPWRFPYTIVDRVRENLVVIVAVAHQSREPDSWHHRR